MKIIDVIVTIVLIIIIAAGVVFLMFTFAHPAPPRPVQAPPAWRWHQKAPMPASAGFL